MDEPRAVAVGPGGAPAAVARRRTQARARLLRAAGLVPRYAVLLVLTVLFLAPWLFLLSTSLKTPDAVLAYPPQWIPQQFDWDNYVVALTRIPYLQYLANTLLLVAVNVFGQLLSCSPVAYSLACVDWRWRRLLLIGILATLMLPTQVTLIPIYVIFSKLHWVNTYLPLTIPSFFGNAAYIFLLRQFFLTISRDVTEAARMDGASDLRIYRGIILPIASPALATVAILVGTTTYTDFFGPLIYLNDPSHWTLALGLTDFLSSRGSNIGGLMAATMYYALPPILLFLGAQRFYLRGFVVQNLGRL